MGRQKQYQQIESDVLECIKMQEGVGSNELAQHLATVHKLPDADIVRGLIHRLARQKKFFQVRTFAATTSPLGMYRLYYHLPAGLEVGALEPMKRPGARKPRKASKLAPQSMLSVPDATMYTMPSPSSHTGPSLPAKLVMTRRFEFKFDDRMVALNETEAQQVYEALKPIYG